MRVYAAGFDLDVFAAAAVDAGGACELSTAAAICSFREMSEVVTCAVSHAVDGASTGSSSSDG